MFSKLDEDHLIHLKQIFSKYRKYGLSLNSKKYVFAVEEGKLLGHIVSEKGICIDPSRVESIQTINLPRNKKELQSFLGKINFLRRFVPNFAELVKYITCMLKKDAEIKWHEKSRSSFSAIKLALTEAPVLIRRKA